MDWCFPRTFTSFMFSIQYSKQIVLKWFTGVILLENMKMKSKNSCTETCLMTSLAPTLRKCNQNITFSLFTVFFFDIYFWNESNDSKLLPAVINMLKFHTWLWVYSYRHSELSIKRASNMSIFMWRPALFVCY